jgi:hypothetical protein
MCVAAQVCGAAQVCAYRCVQVCVYVCVTLVGLLIAEKYTDGLCSGLLFGGLLC